MLDQQQWLIQRGLGCSGRDERRRRLVRSPTNGTYSNQGTTTLDRHDVLHPERRLRESGNPVQLTGGETLEDSAGAGAFEVIDGCGGGNVTGTIPQGQTITVQGATANCSGNRVSSRP